MGSTQRTEVYWRNGRLQPITNRRPSGRGPWPRVQDYDDDELVAKIEGSIGNIEIVEGKAATLSRVNDSFLLHRGIPPDSITTEVWTSIPPSIRQEVATAVQHAEQAISKQWGQFSNEEAITGAFFSRLNEIFSVEGWQVTLSFVEFSKQTKEPHTGTDIAVILDALSESGQRSFKTIWLQAKTSDSPPTTTSRPPRMANQLRVAALYTQAAYGIVYTPMGVFVLGTNDKVPPTFQDVLGQSMQCIIGDTSVEALKESLNRKRIFQVMLTEGEGLRP